MSNGNIALMVQLAKFAGLPWDVVLGSDLVRHYKPDREMYLSAPSYLDLKPEEVMMCAAHVGDLQAARSYGLRTAFIYRPNEYDGGPVGAVSEDAHACFFRMRARLAFYHQSYLAKKSGGYCPDHSCGVAFKSAELQVGEKA